jgi:hypothetical protein
MNRAVTRAHRTSIALGALLIACAEPPSSAERPAPAAAAPGVCAQRDPLRNVYFGDLHVHTARSFDAYLYDTRATPSDAYRFARGEAIALAPLDASGQPVRRARLERPLDFAAVTDHAEMIAENALCVDPSSASWDTPSCRAYRGSPGDPPAGRLLERTRAFRAPGGREQICGADGRHCLEAGNAVWSEIREAAERAYQPCAFTSFIAYEYSATPGISNLHRNVIFRGSSVVPRPISSIDAPMPEELWRRLRGECLGAGSGCDVLAIPHNSNKSNGRMFALESLGDSERAAAGRLRQQLEPLVEIMQHKGDSECRNGMSGVLGAPDELCDFEKLRPGALEDCGEGTGENGMFDQGCISRRDFVRYALVEGLREQQRSGVNPFKLGIIASTDTHDATPGNVDERGFGGHLGSIDAPPEIQDPGHSPGGLAAIWAEENSREALFDAMRRRETFGTSGTRIRVRMFAGWDFASDLCGAPDLVARGYAGGVPMGSDLPRRPAGSGSPRIAVRAEQDPGSARHPGAPLERIQIVKGWADEAGIHQKVYDVAGRAGSEDSVAASCAPRASGQASLCAVFSDPDFDPTRPAVYYARVLEVPTCRHSELTCLALPADKRPASCADPARTRVVRERAWTSPVWFTP